MINLSIQRVPAANGAIGIQTLVDGKPYSRHGNAVYDYDDNVISVDGKPIVIINGDLDSNGVMGVGCESRQATPSRDHL